MRENGRPLAANGLSKRQRHENELKVGGGGLNVRAPIVRAM